MRILKEESAGLVIDIQERLLPHIRNNEKLVKKVQILLEGLRVLDVPVLLTEQYRKGLGETVPEVQQSIATFKPMEKKTFSCCDDEAFKQELLRIGKKNVIICGIETHVCVLQTSVDLLEQGYQPVIVSDAVSSRYKWDRKVALQRMKQEGAIITTTESILFELARISGTDSFKQISKLVK